VDAASREENASEQKARAFSSEVDAGSRKENASKQEARAPFRFRSERKRLWKETLGGKSRAVDARTARRKHRRPGDAGIAGQDLEFTAMRGDASAVSYASTSEPARFTLIGNLAISGLLTWPVFFCFLRPAVLRLKELCNA
jgi:hypothetical protein